MAPRGIAQQCSQCGKPFMGSDAIAGRALCPSCKSGEVKHGPQNVNQVVFPIDEYGVGAWTPERDGKGTCTQVHLTLKGRGFEIPIVLRIKSRESLDQLVRLLNEYGDIVWPRL